MTLGKCYHWCCCHLRSLFTGVVDTGDKFIAGVIVTGDNCTAVSMTLMINLSPVSTTPLICNGNDIETKANESFDNGVFFYSSEANTFESKKIIFKAKRTHLIEQKLFLKQSKHI